MFAATTRARPWSRDPGVWAGVGVVGVIAVLDAVARVQLTGGYAVGAIVASMLTDARGVGVQMVRVSIRICSTVSSNVSAANSSMLA